MLKLIFAVLFLCGSVVCEIKRYDNYTLFKILPKNVEQIKLLQVLHESDSRFDFWSDPAPSADFVNVLTSPALKSELVNYLEKNALQYEIPVSNIQEAIEKEKVKKYTRKNLLSMSWDAYYDLRDINAWMIDLEIAYPTVVSTILGGDSYQGRGIRGIRISHGSGRRGIVLEGGIHAREWISPATVTYILNELLTSSNPEVQNAARDYDWYIFPVTNPDGYEWSHYGNRMWRKNRRPVGSNYGIDLNRNWNNNWLQHGSSSNPASDAYAGPGPFSEPETRSFSEYLRSIGNRIDIYLSFHSYGQLLLLPFGNTTEPLDNYENAMNIGRRAMGALSVRYGTQYVTGNVAEAIYLATGGSIDWVKERLNVPLVYCFELRDRGDYGFILPPDQILPNNLEVMDSVLDIIHQSRRIGFYPSSAMSVKASALLAVLAVVCILLY